MARRVELPPGVDEPNGLSPKGVTLQAGPDGATCASCKYFLRGSMIGGPGTCRRFPPTGILMPGNNGEPVPLSYSVPVAPTAWCGEHRRDA